LLLVYLVPSRHAKHVQFVVLKTKTVKFFQIFFLNLQKLLFKNKIVIFLQ